MGGISHVNLNMTQRIAPNNQYPATHFIEVYHSTELKRYQKITERDCEEIIDLDYQLDRTSSMQFLYTVAIFRIRPNRIPTKHNFNK